METLMIGLAILFVLMVAMFLFFRQKMAYYEVRLALLSDTVQTMAGITTASRESDSETETEIDSESDCESEPKIINLVDYQVQPNFPVEIELIDDIKVEPDDLIVVSDDDTKKIDLPTEFDNFTVKELKEKVAELNGPKLKTKKELIQFLQNKI
jgi:hypothetical protein